MLIANRYRSLGVKAGGGMGEILRCHETHLDRTVVLKTLQIGVEPRRLSDELKALAKLRSKHVVQLYDFIPAPDGLNFAPTIVLEHIDGDDLKVGGYNAGVDYLRVLWQIACGLSGIHHEGIIHRDIKPSNIRLDSEGVVKILDFVLSRSKGIDDKTHNIVGTPGFMAPELWKHGTVNFTSAIDVYAFGITALALVSASLPKALIQMPPQAVSKALVAPILSPIADEIVTLIYMCLNELPTHRPSMTDVANTIGKYILYNEHRALVILSRKRHGLDAGHPKLHLKAGTLGSVSIEYSGHSFSVTASTGAVFFNNRTVPTGKEVPGCCVITFGSGRDRQFVTFDVSNPEVVA